MLHKNISGKCGGFPLAGTAPIRESTEWQQTEWLSKVAMHDPPLEHQPQPNSSPYLLTVPFGELTLFYLSLSCSLALSLPLPLPVLLAVQTGHFCWLGNEKMALFVTLLQLPLRFKQVLFVAFLNICFDLLLLLKGLFISHVTSLPAIAILAKRVLSLQCLLRKLHQTIFETCIYCVSVESSKLLTSWGLLWTVRLANGP